jgi:hypothetical protein
MSCKNEAHTIFSPLLELLIGSLVSKMNLLQRDSSGRAYLNNTNYIKAFIATLKTHLEQNSGTPANPENTIFETQ